LKVVDEAILGYEKFDIAKAIEKIKPDIIVVGYDQRSMEQAVKEYIREKGLKIEIVRIGKFKEDDLDSSLKIKQKIIEHFKR
jgi:FAD synthetase